MYAYAYMSNNNCQHPTSSGGLICVLMCVFICVLMCVYICVCIYVCICVCVYKCSHVCVYVTHKSLPTSNILQAALYVCSCVCLYVTVT